MWPARQQALPLRTTVGEIKLQVWYGFDPAARSWGCPLRQRWGLAPHQHTSPGLEDKVLFTATATGTYEQTAAVVTKWGSPMDDSTVPELVQRVGARAEAQIQARLKTVPQEMAPAPWWWRWWTAGWRAFAGRAGARKKPRNPAWNGTN